VALVAALGACGGDSPDTDASEGETPVENAPPTDLPPPPPGPSGVPTAEAAESPQSPDTRPVSRVESSGASPGARTIVPRSWGPEDVLRSLAAAQRRFHDANLIDEDVDGKPEYGGLAELTANGAGRMLRVLADPILERRLGDLNFYGQAEVEGYLYAVYLPGVDGRGMTEMQRGYGAGQMDVNLVEDFWCAYAWPVRGSGPAYFIGQDGDLLRSDAARYAGYGRVPPPGAALESGGVTSMLGRPANGEAQDRQEWRVVE